jgi:hypothetical protein
MLNVLEIRKEKPSLVLKPTAFTPKAPDQKIDMDR